MKVLVVCAQRYNGHELWTFLGVLQEAGIEFEIVSTATLIEDEITYQPNIIGKTLDDVKNIDDFDGLAFISGNMKDTEKYWDHPQTLDYVRQAKGRDIPIAAICCSVPTVRHAALGKKVSYFPLMRSTERLVKAGAIPQTVSITVDGNLVTAENQMGTQMWAEAFVHVLNGEEVDLGLVDTHWMPGGRDKRPDPDLQRLRDISTNTGKIGLG